MNVIQQISELRLQKQKYEDYQTESLINAAFSNPAEDKILYKLNDSCAGDLNWNLNILDYH